MPTNMASTTTVRENVKGVKCTRTPRVTRSAVAANRTESKSLRSNMLPPFPGQHRWPRDFGQALLQVGQYFARLIIEHVQQLPITLGTARLGYAATICSTCLS
jgi:hypothetical protein